MQKPISKQKIELLAPAGGPEQLTAAVLCGADAVYFGAGSFNARRNAKNFDLESLRETVQFCHLHGTKVHLTVNTLVFDREMDEAMETVRAACEAGVDALIVQDLGLARIIRREAPDMVIHASTQMSLHNPDGVALLEDYGYSRAVLAREMSEKEIERVCQSCEMEVETFVHGALCMCLSGQCYLSAVAGERSGNRGLCAQPCRLPFYEKNPNRCGLSLKDMSLFSHVDRLAQMGVCSLKIEGRMKRPEYVAAAVTAGKAALRGEKPDLETLQAVFSRSGFTDGYFTGKMGANMFGTRQKEDVTAASPALLKNLARLYAKETGLVPLFAEFSARENEPVRLTLHDAEGREASVSGEVPQQAINKPTSDEMVRQSLGKLGGTPFHLKNCTLSLDEGLAIPVSELNRLRREAVENLIAQRSETHPIPFVPQKAEPFPAADPTRRPDLWVRLEYPGQLPREKWEAVKMVILPLDRILEMPGTGYENKIAAQLPPLLFDEKLEEKLQKVAEKGIKYTFVSNLGGILPAKKAGLTVLGDMQLNVTNRESLARLAEMGVSAATLSMEMAMTDCTAMAPIIPRGIFAYGRLPLMTVRNCPASADQGCRGCRGFRVMKDRRGNPFVVDCSRRHDGGAKGGAQVYNFLPLYLADRLRETRGLDFLTLYFTDETPDEAARILQEYQTGGKRENITRGLYYRRVK
ncbi:MAG: U32 family peptidase [Oscillospiraceae bacterium]|nr:U32 family peptidase [Oscillospiraceae bacterium]